jgi:Zn-dependent peptidase ImmA (M78 family)/transcriptional regulator with XRE-family HTH domain
MNAPLVPATLQAARLAQGLSLSGLAGLSKISPATLSRLEHGSRAATDVETVVLANALKVPVAALRRPLVSERLGLSGFYHRKLSRAGAKAVDKIENQCVLDVVALHELLGMVHCPVAETVPTIHLDEINGDVEQAAHMMRAKWGLARGPVQDVCAVVEKGGCLVIHSDFGLPEMDGLYQKVRGVPPIFWVNSRKPLERVRWSIAHELGHLVLHENEPVDHELAETQANQFAAAFLMPRADFRGECPSRLWIPELVEMKRRWRCSMQAIARRARDVGRITETQFKSVMIELSRRGWRMQEPYPVTGESPTLLAFIIAECLRSCEYTEDELADRLAVLVEQIRAWQQPFPGQAPTKGDTVPKLRLATGF